ncbi:hypothetical protein HDV03_004103 [Kappamyces sp. JEL0829]|nr:hypothetical protein HDV03_004103 [Kappamyces sp. JEL0829]
MFNKTYQRIFFASVAISLLVLVPVLSYLNFKAGNQKSEGYETNGIDPNSVHSDFNGMLAYLNVTSFNPSTLTANLHYTFFWHLLNAQNAITPQPFVMIANSRSFPFVAADASPQADVGFIAIDSSSNNYPFDKYLVAGTFVLRATNASGPSIVPAVSLAATIDAWHVLADVIDVTEAGFENSITIYLEFSRASISIFFAIFIGVLMWLLAGSAFILATSVWFRNRKVEPPTIAVIGALLFALPAMRNALPGQPQIGNVFDTAAFFWALLLVATSMVILLVNYIHTTRPEPSTVHKTDTANNLSATILG